jgi:Big-like domain-containing protein
VLAFVGTTVTEVHGKKDRMLRRHSLVLVGLVAFAIGCGGTTPMQPSQSGTATTALAIVGADAVLTGGSANYTVTAALADGSTRTILPAWNIGDPAVASVDSMGRVEGRTHGSTTLTATYNGQSASKTLLVFNNYAGTWEGRYVVRVCSDTGDFTDHDGGWCKAGPARVGSVLSIGMTLVQSGSDVTGTLPGSRGTITGMVRSDGGLTLGGLVTESDFDDPDVTIATLEFGPWESSLDGTSGMTGRWTWLLTSLIGRKGTVRAENELVTMTRVSPSAAIPAVIQPATRSLFPLGHQ